MTKLKGSDLKERLDGKIVVITGDYPHFKKSDHEFKEGICF